MATGASTSLPSPPGVAGPPTAPQTGAEAVGLVWYKCTDLRLLDHEPLSEAHRENKHVVHVFCFDRRWFGPAVTSFGSPSLKTGIHRTRFLLEGVADLQARLRSKGSDLLVLHGLPEQEIPRLARRVGASTVYCHIELTWEEQQVQSAVKSGLAGARLREFWGGNYLFHIDDLPLKLERMPSVFTQFRKLVETKCPVREVLPVPDTLKPLPTAIAEAATREEETRLPSLSALGFSAEDEPPAPPTMDQVEGYLAYRGGEAAALDRLDTYFWKLDLLKEYKETRNGLLGPNFSSKFSPWLATGCLSPRFAFHEIQRYEKARVSNDSTYWLYFELMWRDFFRYSAIHYGNAIFKLGGPQQNPRKYPWVKDMALFEAWRDGKTGYPFIDANMRELKATGFMSNRGRQVVASFLTRDMMVDWRLGAQHFEEYLLDYDPCSNYGNWTYVAGVGSDPREDRYFNVVKQSSTYDADAAYMRFWLPELRAVPKEFCHHPYNLDAAIRRKYNVPEEVYPPCVVPLKHTHFSAPRAKPFVPKRPTATGGQQARGGGGGEGATAGGRGSRADSRASAYKAERSRKHSRLQHDFMT